MKLFFLAVLLIVLLSYGIYKIITGFIVLPSKESTANLHNTQDEQGVIGDIKEAFIYKPAKVLARFINIDMYKREKMRRNLERVGYTETPEEFYANALVSALYMLLASVIMFFLHMGIIAFATIILSVLVFAQAIRKLNKKIKERNDKIAKELPKFIRTYNNSRSQNLPFQRVVEKYRVVAGEAFIYDLDMLLNDLKMNRNEEKALTDFANRINIPHLSQFVSAIIASIKGTDQHTYFEQLEFEMNKMAMEALRRELNKRPGKVNILTIIIAVCVMSFLFYPIIYELVKSFSLFS